MGVSFNSHFFLSLSLSLSRHPRPATDGDKRWRQDLPSCASDASLIPPPPFPFLLRLEGKWNMQTWNINLRHVPKLLCRCPPPPLLCRLLSKCTRQWQRAETRMHLQPLSAVNLANKANSARRRATVVQLLSLPFPRLLYPFTLHSRSASWAFLTCILWVIGLASSTSTARKEASYAHRLAGPDSLSLNLQ